MKKIVVLVNCGGRTCGECEYLHQPTVGYCGIYKRPPEFDEADEGGGHFLRLPECIAAELKEEN